MMNYEVAVIGAGIAGLTCAQKLHSSGHQVVVLDKSRGLGGRLATRRLQATHADHGVCYLNPKGAEFQALLDRFIREGILQPWTDTIHEFRDRQIHTPVKRQMRYASPLGITAIAKSLAAGLTLLPNHHAIRLEQSEGWKIYFEEQGTEITANIVVVAIPAPQAAILLESLQAILHHEFWSQLNHVQFAPCISAIALYSEAYQAAIAALGMSAIVCLDHADLSWIGIDSTKQNAPMQPVFVIQSNAAFAKQYLEVTGLKPAGERLCDRAAEIVAPWLSTPDMLQVHRWRYAFAINPLDQPYLSAETPAPLFCTGDWCGGSRVEHAFQAGLATAAAILANR